MRTPLAIPEAQPQHEYAPVIHEHEIVQTEKISINLPGRDFAVFLLLLLAVDISSLLHIYNLTRLYNEYFFLGVGFFLALCAVLLLLPGYELPRWLRLPAWRPLQTLGALLCLGLAVGSLFMLMRAASHAPDWYLSSHPNDVLSVPVARILLLGSIAGAALLAGGISYARNERLRRVLLPVLAGAWFAVSVVTLLFLMGVGDSVAATWAALIGSGWLVPGAVGLLVLVLLLTQVGPRVFMVVTLGVGLVLRVIALPAIDVSVKHGDMLPLVQLSTTRLLQGQNPYVVYQLPWDLPLTYWPLTMLSYTPFTALGLDIRWANLLLAPVLCALLWGRATRPGAIACYAIGLLYLIPAMLQWDITTEAPVFWLWLSVAFALSSAPAPWPGVGIGLATACSPLALPFAPFLLAHWMSKSKREALVNLAGAVGAGAMLVLPFLLWNFSGFWAGAVTWFNDINSLPRLKWDTDRTWLFENGLAGPFWLHGWEHWLKPLQALLIGGLFLLALRVRLNLAAALRWGTAGFLLFMVFNPVIWPYLYVPALVGLVFAMSYAAPSGLNSH
ncbi:MAG: hypothetical protein WCD37_15780 [Chloroflexia bacterium]